MAKLQTLDPGCMKLMVFLCVTVYNRCVWFYTLGSLTECQVTPPTTTSLLHVESYLGGPVGVHLNHVLGALFDLELDVVLSFEGSQAATAGAHSGLAVRGVWGQRAFCAKSWKKKKLVPHGSLETTADDIWGCVCCWSHKYTLTVNSNSACVCYFWLPAILKLAKQSCSSAWWPRTLFTKTRQVATSVVK